MSLEGSYTATVDRIVEGQAVLLVEDGEETIAERYCPEEDLPEGAGEGSVCTLIFEADELVDIEYQPETTQTRRERNRSRFDRLSRRLGDDDESD